VTKLKRGHPYMQEQMNEQNLSGRHNSLVIEFVLERLDDNDLAQCALTCREWHLMAKREWQARTNRNVTRWTCLRADWEQQHAKWKATRAQLSEQAAKNLDEQLRDLFDYPTVHGTIPYGNELAVLHRKVEDLYARGAGTFAFDPHELNGPNLADIAEYWVCEQTSYDALSEDRLTPAHVVSRLIGMGPAMTTNKRYYGNGGQRLPWMVIELLVTEMFMGCEPKYDSRRLKAVFRFLLEPIAVVSRDYGLYGDHSILGVVFYASNRRSSRQRVIDLLLWCGFGDRWDQCRSNEAASDVFQYSFPKHLWTSSAFWEFFVDERSAGFRAHVRSLCNLCNDSVILRLKQVIVSTPQARKLFIELLNRYAVIRDIVITRFPRELFELARMRERKILRALLGAERGRLLKLRDADENCLLLHVAGCRGCISGVISDFLAAGFDPHRRNAQHQTACDRYNMTSRVRSKQRVCIWNHYSGSDVQDHATACE
jgi:hypothetical protein